MPAENKLGTRFVETHPDDAARVLERLTVAEAAAFIDAVPAAISAGLLRRTSPTLAADCLATLGSERAAEIVANLPVDVAAVLLRRMPVPTAEAVLAKAPEPMFRSLARLLHYAEGTAGSLTDPQALVLPADSSIADAQKLFRHSAAQARYNVYVVDRQQRLIGVLSIRALFLARPVESVRSVMRSDVVHVKARTELSSVAKHPAWLEFDALPVVDASGLFLGVIRHKTLRHLSRPTKEDQLAMTVGLVVSLTEMYWRGLAGLLGGFAHIAQHSTADSSGAQKEVR